MCLEALAQGSGLTWSIRQRRNVGRRGRRLGAEQLRQDPLAAFHRRGPIGLGRRGKEARLREDSTAAGGGGRYTPKMAAGNAGEALVIPPTIAQERGVSLPQAFAGPGLRPPWLKE